MDITVNGDTIPKKTVNMKLKRKYPQGILTSRWKQYIRKVTWKEDMSQETDLVARGPTQKWKQ
jgi:cell division protein FtsI/penicillin-binding protein 2